MVKLGISDFFFFISKTPIILLLFVSSLILLLTGLFVPYVGILAWIGGICIIIFILYLIVWFYNQ